MTRAQVVDIHAHYYPESWLELVRTEGARHGLRYAQDNPAGPVIHYAGELPSGPAGLAFVDLDERIRAMDAQGVRLQALSLTQPMVYFPDGGFSSALAQAFNDGVARAHQRHPDRLVGLAALPFNHPARAVAELERAARLPGMRGVYLATNLGDRDLSDRSLFPVYEAIAGLGLPVFLHPIRQLAFERLQPYFLRNLIGNPTENAVAACHLIFGGVLDAFPGLDVCLPHAGGSLPWLIGRIDQGWRSHPDCRHLPRAPSEYLRRFHYDTITHSDDALRYLVRLVGADRVVLGSDYCFAMGYARPVQMLERLTELGPADRDLVLGGNAARLLRLAPGAA